MKIVGVIENGNLTKELVEYNCIKCSAPVILEFNSVMSENTKGLFTDMATAAFCCSCHCNSKVPELVECLLN